MKRCLIFLLIGLSGVIMVACNDDRTHSEITPSSSSANGPNAGARSGSGSGGGGNPNSSGFLQNVLSGMASRHISGSTDSIFVSFTQPSPAGWVLNLQSNNSAVQVPATFSVPQGVYSVYVPFHSTAVANSITVTISVNLFSQTKSTTINVFPRIATFVAPVLQSPSNGAGFKDRTIINFTSNANANAYYYHLQISNNSAFANPETNVLLDDPLWRQSAFESYGTHYWRMQFVDASGNGGPWSSVRTFEIKR